MACPPNCFSFNKCALCSLDCKTSVSFMQHCINSHSFEVPELRALYNVRPLYFYGKKGLVIKFLEECASSSSIRTDLILTILYEDPSAVSCSYSIEDERVYVKAVSLAKYFRTEMKKATTSEDTQVLRTSLVGKELFPSSSEAKECKNLLTSNRTTFMTPKELEEISELRNNCCTCTNEIKFVSNRLAKIEEKSVDLMLTLRNYLDVTNTPSTSKKMPGNGNETSDPRRSKSIEHFDGDEFLSVPTDPYLEEQPESSSDDTDRHRVGKRICIRNETEYEDELSQASTANISESSTEETPSEEGSMMDSVLLTRLLISNWLTQGQPRVRENQIYHPVEDRIMKNDELCKAVARMILLNPEMIIDPNDFTAQLNSRWFQFVSFHTNESVQEIGEGRVVTEIQRSILQD
ncbi:unnamed protein product [Auanema sp. JU1783]|nr:unnamed protein product [Auanema sp. JU1783]